MEEEGLSLEETNRLRIQLGLRPLDPEVEVEDAHMQTEPAPEEPAPPSHQAALMDRILQARSRRHHARKVTGASLGDQLLQDTGGDAASWLTKVGSLKPTEAPSAQLPSQEPAEKRYSSQDLKGMRVKHDLSDFQPGQTAILTLEDSHVLDDDDEKAGPVLGSSEFVKYKKAAQAEESGLSKEELEQLGAAETGFVIGAGGRVNAKALNKKKNLHDRLQARLMANVGENAEEYDLNVSKSFGSQFSEFSQEIKFKNKKRPRDAAMKSSSLMKDLLRDVSDISDDSHHGSRSESLAVKRRAIEEMKSATTASQRYEKALAKAAEASEALMAVKDSHDNEDIAALDDDFQDEFFARSLNRAKSDVKPRTFLGEDNLLHTLNSIGSGELVLNSSTPSTAIEVSDTSDFLSSLDIKIKSDEADESPSLLNRTTQGSKWENDRHGMQSINTASSEHPDADADMHFDEENAENTDADPLSELNVEPTLGKGLAGVLSLLQNRGTFSGKQKSFAGRANDDRGQPTEDDPAPGIRLEYIDEFGREMTKKEAFRRMAHVFHNQAPGPAKREKILKQREKELKRKNAGATSSLLKLQEAVAKAGQAAVILDAKASVASLIPQRKREAVRERAELSEEQSGSATGQISEQHEPEISRPTSFSIPVSNPVAPQPEAAPLPETARVKKIEFGFSTKKQPRKQ